MKILEKHEKDFKIIEYLKRALTEDELQTISKNLKLKPKYFIRKSEDDYKKLNLSAEDLENDNLVIKKIIENPKILERPIILNNSKATIGRPPQNILDIL